MKQTETGKTLMPASILVEKTCMTVMSKKLLSTLLVAAFAFQQMPVAQAKGDITSGGGNTVNKKLVEDHIVDPSELPDFDKTKQCIDAISERVPKFGEKLQSYTSPAADDPHSVLWYYIPRELRELPKSTTGLHFPTNQDAYQIDKEIFVSDNIQKLEPKTKGRLYLHEILMMAKGNKNVAAVRRLVHYLTKTNCSPDANKLSHMLKSLDFGDFLTKERTKKIETAVTEREKKCFSSLIDESQKICQAVDIKNKAQLISISKLLRYCTSVEKLFYLFDNEKEVINPTIMEQRRKDLTEKRNFRNLLGTLALKINGHYYYAWQKNSGYYPAGYFLKDTFNANDDQLKDIFSIAKKYENLSDDERDITVCKYVDSLQKKGSVHEAQNSLSSDQEKDPASASRAE